MYQLKHQVLTIEVEVMTAAFNDSYGRLKLDNSVLSSAINSFALKKVRCFFTEACSTGTENSPFHKVTKIVKITFPSNRFKLHVKLSSLETYQILGHWICFSGRHFMIYPRASLLRMFLKGFLTVKFNRKKNTGIILKSKYLFPYTRSGFMVNFRKLGF